MQALERKHPTIPMGPGRVARREFEYIRPGTLTLIANFDVAQGRVVAPSRGPTRTAEAFVAHIAHTVASDPTATRWHFVMDHLHMHQSESLVHWVAEYDGLQRALLVYHYLFISQNAGKRDGFARRCKAGCGYPF